VPFAERAESIAEQVEGQQGEGVGGDGGEVDRDGAGTGEAEGVGPIVVGGGAANQAREVAEYLLTQTLARTWRMVVRRS
jgi:hypothetical protein